MVGAENNEPVEIFLHPESPTFYEKYVSPMQRFYSAMLVAYAWARNTDMVRSKNLKILDLGAGVGDTTYAIQELLPTAQVIAVDNSLAMLKNLNLKFPSVKTIQADFTSLIPVEDNSMDMIVSVCAVGLYPDLNQFKKVLSEIKRVLKPGGYFLFDFGHPFSRSQNELGSLQNLRLFLQEQEFIVEPEIKLVLKILGGEFSPILIQKQQEITP